ncbi:MAG: AAA family ATPase [Nitrospinota bacterium]|nr:AAA family ATPase [Nitrospinota bacterium]
MQIREIHIKRFGKFSDFRVAPVLPGLNVIYGRNEFGKTTLLEFIRWVLFGFEKKRKGMNAYTPVDGGEQSGSLMCEMANGEQIFITRAGGTLEGQVKVQAVDREGAGQAHLESFLGHASRKIFKNIYAFALDELQDLDSLMEEEIKNKLLGAGMGLGQVSLTGVEKEINRKREEIFKLRGSNPVMNQRLGEIKKREEDLRARSNEMDRYDELNKKIWVMEKKLQMGESGMEQLEGNRRTLELKRELFPDFIDLEDKTSRLKEMAPVPEMEEESMLAFEKNQAKREDLSQRLEEENAKLRQLKSRRDSISFNQRLLERETEVMQLRQLTELVRSAQADQQSVQQEREQLEGKIQSEMEGIGSDWNEAALLNLEWSDSEKQFVQKQEQALFHSGQFVSNVKNRLELHEEQQVTDRPRQKERPDSVRILSWLMVIVGASAGGYALFNENMELSIIFGAVLALGLGLLAWATLARPGNSQEDLLENLLREKLKKAEHDLQIDKDIWRQWVQDKGLDPETSPERFRDIQLQVREVKNWVAQRKNLDERIERMNKKEDEAAELVSTLAEFAGEICLTRDLLVNIEVLCRQFDDTQKYFGQARDLDAQISEQTGRVESIVAQLQAQNESWNHLLRSAGVDNEEDFIRQWHRAQEKRSLDQCVRDLQLRIQKRVGLGESFQTFMESMRGSNPEQLEHELTDVVSKLEHLQEEQDRANQQIGQLRGEASQMASSEDLARLQNELEADKELLRNEAREWAAYTLALEMLSRGKSQYEKDRQPQVFQAAGRMFSQITEGHYQGVEKPLESDEFRIVQKTGGFKSPVQLSRGTREQLYLSLRLGLIEDYETRAEPLPIVMDDVLVNFDDTRRNHVLDILRDFARDRQVMILSCHEYLLETYLKYGAHQVLLQKE